MQNLANLNLICALQAEARPLIDFYKLAKQDTPAGLSLFKGESDTGPVNLLISGIGPLNMAVAVGWLANCTAHVKSTSLFTAWLNVGTAGHRNLPIGTAVRVAHSSGDSTARDLHLPLVASWSGEVGSLHSVATLVAGYPESALVDMEGSAFFNSVTKFAPSELTQAIKIVSDNEEFGVELLNGAKLTELVKTNIAAISDFASSLQTMAAAVPAKPPLLRELADLSHHLRLSKSRELQLNDAVHKCLNVGIPAEQLSSKITEAKDAAILLKELTSHLASKAPDLQNLK